MSQTHTPKGFLPLRSSKDSIRAEDGSMVADIGMYKYRGCAAYIVNAANAYESLVAENAALKSEIERMKNAEPDFWWCDSDPDESGDSPREAMYEYHPNLEPVKLHSYYIGPTKFGVLYDEGDETNAKIFDTESAAQEFCDECKATTAKHGAA